jgi:antitoxin (DNA-binding transcriptional repressor) of toxin-antitoxin stability system
MIVINTHAAKTKLSKLLSLVEEKGEIVQICRNGKPIAELKPVIRAFDPLRMHPKLKRVKFIQDILSPLSRDEWPEEYR